MTILAIDPGHEVSALVVWNGNEITFHQFTTHAAVRQMLRDGGYSSDTVAIEQVSSYGMPVGREVFETVREIGRYCQVAQDAGLNLVVPTRQQAVIHLCRRMGGDAAVRASLIERFGAPGTKRAPGLTYGLKRDLWQAFGLAVYVHDIEQAGGQLPILTT